VQVYDGAEALLNGLTFGGSGGLWMNDWSAFNSNYDWSGTTKSVPASSWGTFIDVANGPGYLTFARGVGSSTFLDPDMRITVDGVPYVFSGVNTSTGPESNMLLHPIVYRSTLKVELYNRSTGAFSYGLDYTYMNKVSGPNANVATLLTAGSLAMNQAASTATGLITVASVTGAGWLTDIIVDQTYVSAGSQGLLTLVVDGVTKINARQVVGATSGANKLGHFHGPVRFNSSLQVKISCSGSGSTTYGREWHLLD
jgi:hypothetical protein